MHPDGEGAALLVTRKPSADAIRTALRGTHHDGGGSVSMPSSAEARPFLPERVRNSLVYAADTESFRKFVLSMPLALQAGRTRNPDGTHLTDIHRVDGFSSLTSCDMCIRNRVRVDRGYEPANPFSTTPIRAAWPPLSGCNVPIPLPVLPSGRPCSKRRSQS